MRQNKFLIFRTTILSDHLRLHECIGKLTNDRGNAVDNSASTKKTVKKNQH